MMSTAHYPHKLAGSCVATDENPRNFARWFPKLMGERSAMSQKFFENFAPPFPE